METNPSYGNKTLHGYQHGLALFDSLPFGIVYQDAQGQILSANPSAEKILGLSVDQMRGLTSIDSRWRAIDEDGSPFHGTAHPAMVALSTGKTVLHKVMGVFNPEQEAIRWISVSSVPIKDDGETVNGVYTLFEDISDLKLAQKQQKESEVRFKSLFSTMLEGVALHQVIYHPTEVPRDYLFLETNPAFEKHTGLSRESVLNRLASEIFGTGEAPYLDIFSTVAHTQKGTTFETFFAPLNKYFLISVFSPGPELFATVFEDITERKHIEKILQEDQERLTLATLHNGVGIWDWNLNTMEMLWDDSMFALYHIRREDFTGAVDAWEKSLHPEDRPRCEQEIQAALSGDKTFDTEFRVIWPNGEVHHIKAVAKTFRDEKGKALRMLGTNIDISERKRLEEELKLQAHTDYLTGVSNRRHYMEQAEQELNRAYRYKNPMSIFMMDIDFFKRINDSHGHKAGDNVLKKLTEVCRHNLREVDILGRVGGEEFSILLPETSEEVAVEVAERLRKAIGDAMVPLENGSPIRFTVSIGVAQLVSKDDDMDALLNLADQALYEAKTNGRNRVCVAKHV